MAATYLAVWIDHREARVLHLHPDKTDEVVVSSGAHGPGRHLEDEKRFFHDVARRLTGSEPILVCGPSSAKLELVAYLHDHDRAVEARIAGVEAVDHPSDGQIAAYAKKFFGVVVPRAEG